MRNRTYGGVGGGRIIPAPYPIAQDALSGGSARLHPRLAPMLQTAFYVVYVAETDAGSRAVPHPAKGAIT